MATLSSSSFSSSSSSSFSPDTMLHRFVLRRSPFTCLFSQPKQSFPIYLHTTPFLPLTRFFTTLQPSLVVSQQNQHPEIEPETIPSTSTDTDADADDGLILSNIRRFETPLPNLTVKEKKELSSYAHSLGKNLKSQQVGKSGVTDTVIMALLETLEKNELLKLKIHNNCPMEFEDAVKLIGDGTSSVVVAQIGRTVILYRPSMSKLKAEEKKKQNRIDLFNRKSMSKPFYQSRKPESGSGLEPRQLGRGRRGSSRY